MKNMFQLNIRIWNDLYLKQNWTHFFFCIFTSKVEMLGDNISVSLLNLDFLRYSACIYSLRVMNQVLVWKPVDPHNSVIIIVFSLGYPTRQIFIVIRYDRYFQVQESKMWTILDISFEKIQGKELKTVGSYVLYEFFWVKKLLLFSS